MIQREFGKYIAIIYRTGGTLRNKLTNKVLAHWFNYQPQGGIIGNPINEETAAQLKLIDAEFDTDLLHFMSGLYLNKSFWRR